MQRVSLLLGVMLTVLGAGQTSACKYWCKNLVTGLYDCCDDSNPYYNPDEETPSPAETSATPPADVPEDTGSGCYYYCAYDGEVYCCGDDASRIPESHAPHDGRCPHEDEQVCKSSGIFLVTKKAKLAKTSGSIQLVSGEAKEQPVCASDGYCAQEEKCCPSKCARRQICMKSLKEETEVNVDLDEKQ